MKKRGGQLTDKNMWAFKYFNRSRKDVLTGVRRFVENEKNAELLAIEAIKDACIYIEEFLNDTSGRTTCDIRRQCKLPAKTPTVHVRRLVRVMERPNHQYCWEEEEKAAPL